MGNLFIFHFQLKYSLFSAKEVISFISFFICLNKDFLIEHRGIDL